MGAPEEPPPRSVLSGLGRPRASKDGDLHVVPIHGREHNSSSECWCFPDVHDHDLLEDTVLWVHNLEN
jgi:hypothetical protein